MTRDALHEDKRLPQMLRTERSANIRRQDRSNLTCVAIEPTLQQFRDSTRISPDMSRPNIRAPRLGGRGRARFLQANTKYYKDKASSKSSVSNRVDSITSNLTGYASRYFSRRFSARASLPTNSSRMQAIASTIIGPATS